MRREARCGQYDDDDNDDDDDAQRYKGDSLAGWLLFFILRCCLSGWLVGCFAAFYAVMPLPERGHLNAVLTRDSELSS